MKKNIVISAFVSLIITMTMFLLLSYFTGTFEDKKVARVEIPENYTLVAGVIRNEGNGWYLIKDKTHETIGIDSVEETEEMIIVKYGKKTKINSTSVTVDETMAREGYTVGASVSDSEMRIQIFDEQGALISPSDYKNDKGNIWILGLFMK